MNIKNKKVISIILIITGILLIVFSVFWVNKWRYVQNNMITSSNNTENNVVNKNLPGEEVGNTDSNTVKDDKTQEKTIVNDGSICLKREDYKSGLMTILIPKIGVTAGVINGTGLQSLKKGPGLYESGALPNQEGGNVCIAGHRTTYGAWFRNIDKLMSGDNIILEINGLKYIYSVEKVFVVDDEDWSITYKTGESVVTLSACHPLSSSKQRIVARGRLQEIVKK